MVERAFRSEDRIGLVAAVVLHALLIGVLAMQVFLSPPLPDVPQRMTVSLATEVGLESTAPDPVAEARAAIAPTLSPTPAPPAEAAPQTPREATTRPPQPQPRAQTPPPQRQQPRTTQRTAPPPTDTRDRRRPEPARQTPAPATRNPAPPANPGGTRVGENFLDGPGASTRTDETRIPANQIGASARASIQQALARQVKPHWSVPSGVDVEQLITLLDFDLNEDGSLRGRPRLRSQTGVNDTNRPQAAKHVENAIRAVQLAAPFDLPPEYYNAWKSIRGARFDRNLSR